MEHAVEVLKIIEGGLKLDATKVKNYSLLLADKIYAEGDIKLAEQIRRMMQDSKIVLTQKSILNGSTKAPIDQESRLPMADIMQPHEFEGKVVLNNSALKKTESFFEFYKHSDGILAKGLEIPSTILLFGSPGTGKTLLANYIGQQIGLPVVTARLDSMISSFLGSTSKNIRTIFEYANRTPCVLFLDEFDAIAKLRDDRHELGELKRVVNSLLQNIDKLDKNCVLIAATNHEKLLDPAVWRRFSFKIELELPDFNTRRQMISNFIYPFNEIDTELLEGYSLLFDGFSGAAISSILNRAKIHSIINSSDSDIDISSITGSFFEYIMMEPDLKAITIQDIDNMKEKVIYIRKKDPNHFTYRLISRMLNISKSLVQKYLAIAEGEKFSGTSGKQTAD